MRGEQGAQHDAAADQRAACARRGGGGQLLVDAVQQVLGQRVVLRVGLGSAEVGAAGPDRAGALGVLGPEGCDRPGSESPSPLARRSMAAPSTPSSANSSSDPVLTGALGGDQCLLHGEREATARVWASSSSRGSGSICALTMVVISWVTPDWSCRSCAIQVPGLSGLGACLAHRPAQVEHGVDLVALLGGQVGGVAGLRQLVGGRS